MTYELAKELKDAGFSQTGNGLWSGNVGKINLESILPGEVFGIAQEDFVYLPTLSELIEACGYGFFNLEYWSHPAHNSWLAKGTTGVEIKGSTPEEAVARLWLALNKKI